jgi:hypothetical protein
MSAFSSQGETEYGRPGAAPTARMRVSGSLETARRFTAGSRTKTRVPAGASTSCPSSVNAACPRRTT